MQGVTEFGAVVVQFHVENYITIVSNSNKKLERSIYLADLVDF